MISQSIAAGEQRTHTFGRKIQILYIFLGKKELFHAALGGAGHQFLVDV